MLLALGLAVALVAYNTVTNLRPTSEPTYLVRNVAAGVVLVVLARAAGLDWGRLGLDAEALPAGVRWGRVAVLGIAVAIAAGAALAPRLAFLARLLSDRRADLPPGRLAYHVLVRIPVGTAAFEEVAFRGVLLGALLAVASTGTAVAVSSLVFGAWHVAPTLQTLRINGVTDPGRRRREVAGAVVATTVGGALFALLRLASGSVVAPIMAHAAVNGFGLLAAAVFRRTGGAGADG